MMMPGVLAIFTFQLSVAIVLLPLLAVDATSATSCIATPPSPHPLRLCAPPWSGTAQPVAGDVVTINATSTLPIVSATVNGVAVPAPFPLAASSYGLEYTTEAGGEEWPWSGLHVAVVFANATPVVVEATLVPGAAFTEEASARNLAASASLAVCMADVDGDNDVDYFMTASTHQLWLNDGGGAFSNAASTWGVDASFTSLGCGFGDADGDGLLDLVVTGYGTGANLLYMHQGAAFSEEAVGRGVASQTWGLGLSWGDIDGDGDLDLYVCNELNAAANTLFINDGSGNFEEDAALRGVEVGFVVSRQSALLDLDGDGDLDLLVANGAGSVNTAHINDGSGYFVEEGSQRGFDSALNSETMCVGDWSGDGTLDAYVSMFDQADQLYVNNGDGYLTEVGSQAGIAAASGQSQGVTMFDVELDGDVDIFLGSRSSADYVWLNDGRNALHDVSSLLSLGGPSDVRGAVAGDVDGDGDLDLFTASGSLLYINPNARASVRRAVLFRPLSPSGAPSVFGTTVRLECVAGCAPAWVSARWVDGGSSYFSQNAYDAHFGVPDENGTYNGTVEWGGGSQATGTWETHPRLGSIMPWAGAPLVIVVRPAPANISLGAVQPYDFAGVTVRAGGEPAPPAIDDIVLIPIVAPLTAHDLHAVHATVSGQDVTSTLTRVSAGVYALEYRTMSAGQDWPWAGLHVEVALEDSGGLVSVLDDYVVPGTTLELATATSGLSSIGETVRGVCMGDLDGDGDVDVFLASSSGHLAFFNTGGVFSDARVATGVSAMPAFDGVGCGVSDPDDDGDLDLFVLPMTGTMAHLVQGAGGVFTDEAAFRGFGATSIATGRSLSLGDVDGDGYTDVFVSARDGLNQLFVNDGDGVFTPALEAASGAASFAAILVDLDGDFDLDIAVVNSLEANELHINTGDGSFVERARFRGFADEGEARGLASGDISGDGLLDLIVTQVSARDLLFVNTGGGSFVEEGLLRGFGDAPDTTLDVWPTDIDHDGDLDIVVSGTPSSVWVNGPGGKLASLAAEFGVTSDAIYGASGDIDGDGDEDFVMVRPVGVYMSHSVRVGVGNWVAVRPLTAAGAPSAFGATVRLRCVAGCQARQWAAVRTVDGPSGLYSQSAYGVRFGLPAWGESFDVEVVFAGGAAHDKGTDGRLGGVVAGSVTDVVNRPYLESVAGVFPSGGAAVGINGSVVVVLQAGQGRTDLVPADGCCFVNGVQVAGSFVGGGDGTYNLTYVVGEGHTAWGVGELAVVPTLQSAARNLSMVDVVYTLDGTPAGDPVAPGVVFQCRPGAVSHNVWEDVCVACPGEGVCTFSYVVGSTSLATTEAPVPTSNYTGTSSATFRVGPFNNTDVATLRVSAVDGAGNRNHTQVLEWLVDTSAPVTTLVDTPEAVTQRSVATFTLQCSEAACSFEYVLDGGSATPVGANVTSGGAVPVMGTRLLGAPERVSNGTAPVVVFGVSASDAGMLVNATVEVGLGARSWTLAVVGNATEPLELPALADGRYVLSSVSKSRAGVVDVTPVQYEFTVDARPPVATIVVAPGDGEEAVNPVVVVAADEDDCVFMWRAGPVPLMSPWQLSTVGVIRPDVDTGGAYGFEVRAVDAAGNAGAVASASWVPSACPSQVPDVAITANVGTGAGHRYVAFSGDTDTFEYRLDGGAWVQTAAPRAVLEGVGRGMEHVVEVRAAVPGVCDARLADTRPPAHRASWVEPPPLPAEVVVVAAPDAFTPNVFAEFLFSPNRRLAWLEYSLDGEAWTPCEAVLVLGPLQAGEHTVQVRAVDAWGNGGGAVQAHTWTITAASDSSIVLGGLPDGEHSMTVIATDAAGSVEVAPQTFTWRVDTTRPVLFGNRTSRRFSTSRTAVVSVTCEGEVDPCAFCWTSTTVPNNCSHVSPVLLVAPNDGEHQASIHAVDSVLLESVEAVDVVWTVDSTPPSVVLHDVDGAFVSPVYNVSAVDVVVGVADFRLNVTASEVVQGMVVTVNGVGGASLVPGPVLSFSDMPPGANAVAVAGVDLSGNVGTSVALRVLVDVEPPDATVFGSGLRVVTNQSMVPVPVASVDNVGGSGVEHVLVAVDGAMAALVAGAAGIHTLTGLAPGSYNVSAAGVDVAGNVDDSPTWRIVTVDQEPPASTFATPLPDYHPSSQLVVWADANEAAALFGRVVGLTGWQPANSSGALTLTGLPDGRHTVEVRSVDLAGNLEVAPYLSAVVVVDSVRPIVSWVQPPPAYTMAPDTVACFAVNDSSPVTLTAEPAAAEFLAPSCVRLNRTQVADGLLGVRVTGVDAAGNVGEVLTGEWVLDREAPVVVVEAVVSASPGCVSVDGGDTVCNAADGAVVEVSCSDGDAAVAVAPCRPQFLVVLEEAAVGSGCVVSPGGGRRRLEGGFEDAPGGTFVLEGGGGDGRYAVAVRGVDEAGNIEEGNVTMRWYVDTVDPVRPTFVQQPVDVVSTDVVLFVMQLEGDNSPGQTTFWYRLDEGGVRQVGDLPGDVGDDEQLELAGLATGNHKVEVWAVDQGGNVGPSTLRNWAVVTEAPGVVILEHPAAVSGDVTPSFAFAAWWAGNASEPAAGVEVSLNGAAEYAVICEDTVESGGVCVWNASLAETGVGAYTINVRASIAGNVGNPTPFAWQYTVCSDDQFAEFDGDGGISCLGCPVGGSCEGGLTRQADIVAVQGFWAPEGSSGLRFYECPVDEACLPGGAVVVGNETVRVVGQCAEGYKGTLCAVCEDGFFEQFGMCVSCGTDSGVAWLVMFAVLIAVVFVAVLFFKFRDLMPIDQLKVTLSMVQIIASANTAYDIPWPPLFAGFLNTMRVFLIEAVSLTRANCAQPMTFYGSLVVTLVGFKVVLLVIVLGPVVVHKCKHRGSGVPVPRRTPPKRPAGRRRRTTIVQAVVAGALMVQAVDWAKIFKITFLFLFVAYPGVSLKIMTIFKCVEVEGEHWLMADMRLRCYEGDWYGYALYAIVMGCLYTGGLPLAITMILWRNRRKLGEDGVVAKWGFLYESYGVGAYLWEVVELLRKLWLSALVVLMAEGSPLQVTVAVLISGWAHVLHAVYKPWRDVGGGGTSVYALQHGSLLVTFFVFLMGLLFKVEGVGQDGATYNFLAWAMLLACVGFMVVAGVVFVVAGMAQLRQTRRRQSTIANPAGGPVAHPLGPLRAGASPRAVRSRVVTEHGMAWVGNPLRKPSKASSAK